MKSSSHVAVTACVAENEHAIVQLAAGQIARALSQGSGVTWTSDCAFVPRAELLSQAGDRSIVVTSLQPELEAIAEPWRDVEQRVRTAYAALGERGDPVFACTIFRHVGLDVEPELASALRIRIRRLNLLAAELSRELGAYVVDLDRALADLGARRLETDYRLGGDAAVDVAAHALARTVVGYGVDALVPWEVQERAKASLDAVRPKIATHGAKRELRLGNVPRQVGPPRRRQSASLVAQSVPQQHARSVVRQVLRGDIGRREAVGRLFAALRRRSVRESVTLLIFALSRKSTPKQ